MSVRPVALLCGALSVLAIGGCGGGGEEASPATGPLTSAEFFEQGNEICASTRGQMLEDVESFADDRGLSGNEEPTRRQSRELVEEVILPNVSRQASELSELKPPADQEKQFARFIERSERVVAELEDEPALDGIEKKIVFAGVNQEALRLGLASCAEGI